MVVVGMLGLSATAPTGAQAFLGESSVLNGAKTTLTGPAKSIITNPTFLPEEVGAAATYGGATEAGAAASVFETAGVLPALGGSLLAFGVGAAVGTEICEVLGIEGCWTFASIDADPAEEIPSYQWVFVTSGGQPNTWYWDRGTAVYTGYKGSPTGCGSAVPPGISFDVAGKTWTPFCEGKAATEYSLYRSALENRTLTYTGADDPEVSNYSHTAPSNWADQAAGALKEQSGTPAARVGEKIASEIEGSEVKDPYADYVAVPSCSGEAWIECKADLEELELVPERSELTWEDAHLDLAPDEVVELQPSPQTEVETGSKVVVTTNPDEAGMPVLIPPPEPGETYDEYAARLVPSLDPSRVNVSPEFTDPGTGPDGVIRTVPKSGTRTNPATETEVDVQTNPPDAPPAAGAWTAPAIPAIDLSPLSGVAIGCNDFPFGIFCWIGDGLTSWGASGVCPNVDVPLGTSAGVESGLPFDFCQFEPAMEIVRPILVVIAAFSLAYLFAAAAMGFGGSTGSED